MRLRPAIVLAFTALLACGSAAVAADSFVGKYASSKSGYRQNAEIARTASGYAVSLAVGTRGCSGLFEGAGSVEAGQLIARSTDTDPDTGRPDNKCRLTIKRTPSGITVQEDGCSNWHGASCDFEGTLRKR